MPTCPPARLVPALVLGTLVALLVPAAPAVAAVVILKDGDIVHGELDGDLTLATDAGPVAVDPRALDYVVLSTQTGDVLYYRNGTAATGLVARPTYSIRLPSGQTIVVGRERVAVIRFGRR